MQKKILVVDDNANERKLLEQILTDEGYEVESSSDGKKALEIINANYNTKQYPDMIISDISMPNMDGIEMLGKMLGIDSNMPVVLYTAYPNYKDNLLAWAAQGFVVKNSDPSKLLSKVKHVFEEKERNVRY